MKPPPQAVPIKFFVVVYFMPYKIVNYFIIVEVVEVQASYIWLDSSIINEFISHIQD